MTFVDGLGVGDISDVALRDRRHLSEDGVLIVVATLSNGLAAAPELISRGFAESDDLLAEMRGEAQEILRGLLDEDIREIKLIQEHLHDGIGQLVYDRTRRRPMILPGGGRDMSDGWADAISAERRRAAHRAAAHPAPRGARDCRALVLPAARALGARQCRAFYGRRRLGGAAGGCGAGRGGARAPSSGRCRGTCSSSSRSGPRAARGSGSRVRPSSSTGSPCSSGRASSPTRTASPSPTSSSRCSCGRSRAFGRGRRSRLRPDRGSLWAGLFDLRENLFGRAQDDLHALAA